VWMYTNADNSLQNRLWLDDGLGTWLDYWLFLHSDDTHSIWLSRPIGIKAIANAALFCGRKDQRLLEQLQKEIDLWLGQIGDLTTIPILPSSNGIKYIEVEIWDEKWEKWFKSVEKIDSSKLDNENPVNSLRLGKLVGIKDIAADALLCGYRDQIIFHEVLREFRSWLTQNNRLVITLDLPYFKPVHQAEPEYSKYVNGRKHEKIKVWSQEWENWLKKIQKVDHQKVEDEVVGKIAGFIYERKFSEAFKCTRTLASELGSRNLSRRYLYRVAKNLICDSGQHNRKELNQHELYNAIADALLNQTKFDYLVSIKAEDLQLTTSQLGNLNGLIQSGELNADVELVNLRESGDIYKPYIFGGFKLTINASHFQQAFDIALDIIVSISSRISRSKGPQVKLLSPKRGDVVVVNQQTLVAESKLLFFPRILWDRYTGSRRRELATDIPGFSKYKGKLSHEEIKDWKEIMNKSCQVKDNWCNYPRRSAADIWQLLEQFSSSTQEKPVDNIVNRLFDYLPKDALKFLANQISSQSNLIADLQQGSSSRWHFWDEARQPQIDEWVNHVLDRPNSRSHFTQWDNPHFPIIAFEEEEGLVQIMSRVKKNADQQSVGNDLELMKSRLEGDLILLREAIRHKENHDGKIFFPDTIVRYLGRVGFEALFMIMTGDVQKGA
jgi:formylmethanofuran dehydrogenase subunit D